MTDLPLLDGYRTEELEEWLLRDDLDPELVRHLEAECARRTPGLERLLAPVATWEPGWYETPAGRGRQRWWDGSAWTMRTRPTPRR